MWSHRVFPKLTLSFVLLLSARRAKSLQSSLLSPALVLLSSRTSLGSLYYMSASDMGTNSSKDEGPPIFKAGEVPAPKRTFTEEELKSKLTTQEYDVTQNKGKHLTVVVKQGFKC